MCCVHVCVCVYERERVCVFWAMDLGWDQSLWVIYPSSFLPASSIFLSLWLPFLSGLSSLHSFPTTLGGTGHKLLFSFHTGTSQHLHFHHFSSICLSSSIPFLVWGWVAGEEAPFIEMVTIKASVQKIPMFLFLFLMDSFSQSCSTDGLAVWIEGMEKNHE